MVIVKPFDNIVGVFAHKKLGRGCCFGERLHGYYLNGEYVDEWGIYQQRRVKGKIVNVKMRFSKPKYQNQPNKIITQNKFKAGMLEWKGLTEGERLAYHVKGTKRRMHGVNVFLKKYLKTH